MSQPLVTVITPLYNYELYIGQAIESVLNQTYPHIEMIVVDDGSTDQGPAVVERYRHQGVKLFRQPRHGYGVARALNLAIQQAQGEYISWLSADDYYLPHKIARNIEFFQATVQERPRLGIIHSQPAVECSDLNYLSKHCPLPPEEQEHQISEHGSVFWSLSLPPPGDDDVLMFSLVGNSINGCTTLVPKRIFAEVGGFKNSWAVTQDYEMWLRIMMAGYEVGYLPEALTVTRFHPINVGQYHQIVPTEANLVTRWAKEQVSLHQLKPALDSQSYSPEFFPSWYYAQLQSRPGLEDEALWVLEQEHVQLSDVPAHVAHFRHILAPFDVPPIQWALPLTWVITLTPLALTTKRLMPVLTEFCIAFDTNSPVRLVLWVTPELSDQLPLAQWQTEIAHFLQCPLEQLPQLIATSAPLTDVLSQALAYVPVGNPDQLEQQCIYSLRSQGRLIQWAAEHADFKQTVDYLMGFIQWGFIPPPNLNTGLRRAGEHNPLTYPLSSSFYCFAQKSWWHLSPPENGLRQIERFGLNDQSWLSIQCLNYAIIPLPERPYCPDWLSRSPDLLELEGQKDHTILILYTTDNASHWHESLQSFLQVALNHPEISLLVLAQAPSEAEEIIFNEILDVIVGQGIDPDTIDNIQNICLSKPDWSAIFQTCWLWIHPVSTPALWEPYWPALAHSKMALLTLPWMSSTMQSLFWLSSTASIENLSKTLQQSLNDRNGTAQRGQSLAAHFPAATNRDEWLYHVIKTVTQPSEATT